MPEHNWTWKVATKLASARNAHIPLMEDIVARMGQIGWTERELFGIQMALEESLSNAIRHGNKLDESKQVAVECRISPQRFWLRVEDEGEGFDPRKVPDCTMDESLHDCGGRGVMLITAYMTQVDYNQRGNCVTMEKVRNGAATSEP
jgi:serine/threonine-protein kinase RsbW